MDFEGTRDVKEVMGRAQVLRTLPAVPAATERKQSDERYESTVTGGLNGLMEDMNDPKDRAANYPRVTAGREVGDAESQQFLGTLR